MTKERCAECGCHVYEQKDGVYVCIECGKPYSLAEKPPEDLKDDEKRVAE